MSPVLDFRYSPREPRAQGRAELRQLGPQLEIALFQLGEPVPAEDQPRPITGRALIDTGASVTCVDREAAETAGLSIVGSGPMMSATHEREIVPVYAGKIRMLPCWTDRDRSRYRWPYGYLLSRSGVTLAKSSARQRRFEFRMMPGSAGYCSVRLRFYSIRNSIILADRVTNVPERVSGASHP